MFKNILVVAAHPDDEVLGCGGTIAKLAQQDAHVHIAFLADGVSSRDGYDKSDSAELQNRRNAAMKACEILGATEVTFDDFPDNRLDSTSLLDIIKPIESLVATHSPDAVLTHHGGDLNVDHRRVHQAVVTACRPQPGHPVQSLLFFEVPSSTEWQVAGTDPAFAPNWFVDVSGFLDSKILALDAYADELRSWPHPRSRKGVEHLAHWRGATIGVDAAEAFVLGRQLS